MFGESSEKLRNKLEKKIREAEKRLGEMEERLNMPKGCLETAAAVTAESDVDVVTKASAEKPVSARRPLSRKPLPAALLRETVRIEPAEAVCPVCAGELAMLCETVTEQLDIINNAFNVIETIRPKLACRKCDAIVQAPLPTKPIDRSYASPGLLARILVSKYVEHIPPYRQGEISARHGLALNRYVLETGKVHADDTPVPRFRRQAAARRAPVDCGVYVRDGRNTGSSMPAAVWFTYSPDRKGAHPQRHLAE